MSRHHAWLGSFVLLTAVGGCLWTSVAEEKAKEKPSPAAESLLPAEAVVYIGWDGREKHREAFEKTAAYDAIYRSGLADVFEKILNVAGERVAQQSDEQRKLVDLARQTAGRIWKSGFSLALALPGDDGPPKPYGVLVLHEAADLGPGLAEAVRRAAEGQIKFETQTISGREVTRGTIPAPSPFPIEIGWWAEGKHLVVVVGAEAVSATVSVATGKTPNITTNPLWKKYARSEADFEVSTVAWLDLGSLRKRFGEMPIPADGVRRAKPVTVNEILGVVGLGDAGALVSRSGYRGAALWSETTFEAPEPRKGLLALADQEPITLKDLPPLPAATTGFYASSLDWSKLYTTLTGVARQAAKLGPEEAAVNVEVWIERLPEIIGFDPKEDLFDALGNVACLYGDPHQGWFGLGFGLAIEVKDADRLRKTVDQLLGRLTAEARPDQVRVERTKKSGREVVTLAIARGMFNPSLIISDKWLSVGLSPQTVEAFALREDGKLPTWSPSEEHREALEQLPKKFTSIAVSDPRATYRTLLGFAPMVVSAARIGLERAGPPGREMGEIPFSAADLPPAELVTRKLFPNVTVTTVDDEGVRRISRRSVPSVPFLGDNSVATTAVMAALLLPAVQQAREAARRSACKNNLKQLGLAMHNYHDTHRGFPPQASVDEKGKKLLSWRVHLLPWLEQEPLYRQFRLDEPWDSPHNRKLIAEMPQVFACPSVALEKGKTVYVAPVGEKMVMTGGKEGTRIASITDGTSNTIMIVELAPKDAVIWTQPDDLEVDLEKLMPWESAHPGGFQALFADGSVRFIAKAIDAGTLRALFTRNGGEAIGEF